MSNDSEKGNNIWKQTVVRFLLLSAILVSFLIPVLILILSVEIWIPKLLESTWIFITGKQLYKQIFTTIILLASVSLLSFLLQRYMATGPRMVDKTWRQAVARFLLLPRTPDVCFYVCSNSKRRGMVSRAIKTPLGIRRR